MDEMIPTKERENMTKHTPGPWTADNLKISRVGPGARPIASLWVNDAHKSESQANAQLIAAAPDLLAALKTITNIYGIICEVICPDNPPPHGTETLAASRKAISSAEGRS